jgi:hypothetical protein
MRITIEQHLAGYEVKLLTEHSAFVCSEFFEFEDDAHAAGRLIEELLQHNKYALKTYLEQL